MTTSEHSQQIDLFPTEYTSTSSPGDFPAKIFPLQEDEKVLRASEAAFGQTAPDFLGKFDRDTPCLRMSQTCLQENGEIGFAEFSGIFPRSGMMRSGTVYQLPRLARTTTEIASGLSVTGQTFFWRTPDTGSGGTPLAFLQGETTRESGHRIQVRLNDQVKLWPTPAASRSRGAAKNRFYGSATYKRNLDEAVRTSEECGQLNPDWVEWLMGYPTGHTDLRR